MKSLDYLWEGGRQAGEERKWEPTQRERKREVHADDNVQCYSTIIGNKKEMGRMTLKMRVIITGGWFLSKTREVQTTINNFYMIIYGMYTLVINNH